MTSRFAPLAALVVLAACAGTPDSQPPLSPPPPSSASAAPSAAPADDGTPKPPVAKKDPKETEIHGLKLVDDYWWLRQRDTPEVLGYLAAENAYTKAMTDHAEPLRKALYDELLSHVKEDDSTPPYKDGKWFYYQRYEKGKQYPIYCRKQKLDDPDSVILDLNEIGKTEKFVSVKSTQVSDSGEILAYLLDTQGSRLFTLKIKDLKTGKLGPEAIPNVDYVAFAKDGKTVFYVTENPKTKQSNKLWRHSLGSDSAKDTLVYEEKDGRFDLSIDRTRDKVLILVTSASATTSEVSTIDAAKPAEAPKLIAAREQGHEYYVDHRGDSFYIMTNSAGRNFRVVTAKAAAPSKDHWKELVPHRDDVMIDNLFAFKDHLVLIDQGDALRRVEVVDYKTGKSTTLAQPEPVYGVSASANAEFDTPVFRFRYESLTTPPSYVDVDLKTGARKVVKAVEIPSYDASRYESKRVYAPARDGTPIPVSLVYQKGITPDATHPLYLSGYGAYGIPLSIHFAGDRLPLLDRGVVVALAHVRGGGDMGKKWHDQGRMANKMNTFTDFIDVAEYLKKERWTKPDGLAIAGGSAGGLLMGAVANMRPDLFKVVMVYVPFVDVINTMLDETLPLTVNEFEEWGNPKIKAEFDWMLKYSPYDNVAKKDYPTMLVRSSYYDNQVMYWEPAKFVAKLRASKTDKNPLLLKINMDPSGHGGQAGRYDALHDTAFDYAFLLEQLGVTK